MDVLIENVRSFAGHHAIPIKPLTVLTGENSSGKSTLLAVLSIVSDTPSFPWRPRFNEPPFSLGSFDTIATYKGGSFGRATKFTIGTIGRQHRRNVWQDVLATYCDRHGQPALCELLVRGPDGTIELQLDPDTGGVAGKILIHNREHQFAVPAGRSSGRSLPKELSERAIYEALRVVNDLEPRELARQMVDFIEDVLMLDWRLNGQSVLSIAPIRSRPRRTYDEFSEEFSPEGEHIPFVLMQNLKNERFVAALERFGRESGLFRRLDVKRLGTRPGDPIQILVTGSGRSANLLDVGYGVSQAVPVVAQCLLSVGPRTLLLQQPEVHLHPRAQAALGSFFVEMVVHGRKQMVVETHSDYIVDRIRQEIAGGNIDPRLVEIVYFEKHGSETQTYTLSFDDAGNIMGAPPSYREFFLREEINLLRRAAK